MLVYARTHTQTKWVLDVSPGVGRTPGEPEESRSTKVQYTCRPYRCTSLCFVSATMESGKVIPLHIASADNMADFGTATSMFVDLCRCKS